MAPKTKPKQAAAAPALHTWLPLFISTKYFDECLLHPEWKKSGCHIFCIDCQSPALCKGCVLDDHRGHNVLPVRKVSRKLAIVTSELRAAAPGLLLSDVVQSFSCNGFEHTFLSPRFQDYSSPNVKVIPLNGRRDFCPSTCNVPLEYCSLNCKVVRQGLVSLGVSLPRLQPVVDVDSGVGVPEGKKQRAQVKKEKAEEPDCAVGGTGGGDNSSFRNCLKPLSQKADGDGHFPFDLAKLGSSKRRRGSNRKGASERAAAGAKAAANADAAAEALQGLGTGPGTGGGTGAAGGCKLSEKVKPDPRGFSMLVEAGVENREFEVAEGIADGLSTWLGAQALLVLSQSKEKWDFPQEVADPIEKGILDRFYRRQLEKKKEAATGDPALREEA